MALGDAIWRGINITSDLAKNKKGVPSWIRCRPVSIHHRLLAHGKEKTGVFAEWWVQMFGNDSVVSYLGLSRYEVRA